MPGPAKPEVPLARPARPLRPPTQIEPSGHEKQFWVAWPLDSPQKPAYPACCPCCLEPPARNTAVVVLNKGKTMRFAFPACDECARHHVFDKRASDLMGTSIFFLAVLTIAVWLVSTGGAKALLEPFRNPIRAAFFAFVGMFIMIAWAFVIRYLIVLPLRKILGLNKKSCRSHDEVVKWGTFDKPIRTGLGFDNLEYGRRFAKENGFA
jgi:hypothetical protein